MELKELIKALWVMDPFERGGHGRWGVGRWATELVQEDLRPSLTWDFLVVVVVAGVGGGWACSRPGVRYFLKGKFTLGRDGDLDSASASAVS